MPLLAVATRYEAACRAAQESGPDEHGPSQTYVCRATHNSSPNTTTGINANIK